MSGKYSAECNEMQMLTQEYVLKLTKIWETIFDHDTCNQNLRKLVDHARNFYDELVEESLARRSYIEKEISDLKGEAEELKRLLMVDIELPTCEHMPLLIVQSELDRSLENLREQLRERREHICELLLEQEALCEEIGESPRALLADPLPTAEEINNFGVYLENLREEKTKRMKKVSTLRREIKQFLQILNVTIHTDTEDRLLNHRQIKLNADTLEGLQRMHNCFSCQVDDLRDCIDSMRRKLNILWDRLNASPNTRNKFRNFVDYNQHTYDKIYAEVQRCETLKSQNIKLYVEQIRDEIREWWDKTLKSQIQRNRFSNFHSTCYTEDLLVLHEMELEDLKLLYENNKNIFDLYADRNILWNRMQALEAKASDPGRYNNRGGQLLKEEKERKTIANKLPKIEQQICELAQQYEKREHVPFLVYGQNIIDVMSSQWEMKRQEKEKLSSARKNASVKTPLAKNNITRTPMSQKNITSMSIRKTPSSVNLTAATGTVSNQKRKLNINEKSTPFAKRNLLHALDSPSIFAKPSGSNKYNHTGKCVVDDTTNNKTLNFKSPMRKIKVLATTLRRKSGRHSGNIKKRRSTNQKQKQTFKVPFAKGTPKIVISQCISDGYSDNGGTEDTYDSFQKCIEPCARSSILHGVTNLGNVGNKRLPKSVSNENIRPAQMLKQVSRQRNTSRTPTKQRLMHYTSLTNLAVSCTPVSGRLHSPVICSTGRKLTTKNLPIII